MLRKYACKGVVDSIKRTLANYLENTSWVPLESKIISMHIFLAWTYGSRYHFHVLFHILLTFAIYRRNERQQETVFIHISQEQSISVTNVLVKKSNKLFLSRQRHGKTSSFPFLFISRHKYHFCIHFLPAIPFLLYFPSNQRKFWEYVSLRLVLSYVLRLTVLPREVSKFCWTIIILFPLDQCLEIHNPHASFAYTEQCIIRHQNCQSAKLSIFIFCFRRCLKCHTCHQH